MNTIQSITDSSLKEEWNTLVSHPLQTWEWGEIKKESGNKVLRLAEINKQGKLKQVYLFTEHKLPLNRLLLNYAKGPWPTKEIFSYLHKEYGKLALLIKLEPEVFLNETGKYHLPILNKHWQREGLDFYLSNSAVFARHTFIVDLIPSEPSLLAGMKSKTRYNINLARRKGVKIVDETNNPQGFTIFYNLFLETIKRQKYLGHGEKYHRLVWETMKNKHQAKIMVAYYNNEPLSAYTLFFYKHTAYYLYGGSSEAHKEVMASNLLMWESLLLAKSLSCQSFDMWGALEENYDLHHPWSGFHRFKEGFGGEHQSYLPTIDLVFRQSEYKLFSFLWPWRTKLLEFKSSFSQGSF